MSLKCNHPWHFMGPKICPGCKNLTVNKNLAGLVKGSPEYIARGGDE